MEVVLPENLILEVLSRLPVKAIIQCKCVCKHWRELVSDPYFVRLHLSRSPEAFMIDTSDHLDPANSINLHLFPRKYPQGAYLAGSVNGLVCFRQGSDGWCIINPVFELEYMNLPKPQLTNHCELSCGFGVSMAGEYKVIRICCRRIQVQSVIITLDNQIEVYTLGTGQWRVLGQAPSRINLGEKLIMQPGVFLNSHLYWVVNVGQIYDFDLDTETFELLFQSPPECPRESKQTLGVLKGRLSLAYWCSLGLEVWVMKGESWCKEITLQDNISHLLPSRPLCLTDGLKGTNSLVLYDQSSNVLVAYCLNTKTIINLNLNLHGYFYSKVRYHPSLVKLHEFESEESSCHVTHVQYGEELPSISLKLKLPYYMLSAGFVITTLTVLSFWLLL